MTRLRLHQALRLVLQKHEREVRVRAHPGCPCAFCHELELNHAAILVDAAIAELCYELEGLIRDTITRATTVPDPAAAHPQEVVQ